MTARRTIPVLLLLAAGLAPLAPPNAQAGPLLRRAQERKACQEFAVKLQTASANPQQAQACQEFASKLQGAQGNPAQAQQIYAMGSQKLSGMFGPNPCPNLPKP
jgi:hypothetical protein